MNTYRIKEGAHWKAAPAGSAERMKLYQAGDLISLTPEAAGSMAKYVDLVPGAPAAVAEPESEAARPAPPAEPVSEPDPEPATASRDDIADTPWQTLKARVADMEDADEVRAVLEAEETGKERPAVLGACRARLEELASR